MLDAGKRKSIALSLKRVPLFASCQQEYLESLVDDFRLKTVEADTRIITQFEETTEMYIVLGGHVQVTLWSEEGEEFIIRDFGPGDFFGEMSLIDGNPRSANVTSITRTTLAVLEKDRFVKTVRKEPMVAFDLLMFLVQRLRHNAEMLESFAFLDVRERLEKLLAGYVREEGSEEKDGWIRIRKLTHKEMAARTGSSREAVSKVMKVLAANKLVKVENKNLLVSPRICRNFYLHS